MKTKMKTNIACHLLLATAAVLTSISPVHAEDGGPKIIRERIMWCDKHVEETGKTDLPRVLFIGDSISAGYRGPAQEALKGKAYFAYFCSSIALGDPTLFDELKLMLGQYKFDVIHFNVGMHGWGYTEADYRAAFPNLIALLKEKAPGAKLICATTTPYRTGGPKFEQFGPMNERVKVRNQIAAEFAAKEGILLNDIYSVKENTPEQSADGVHFKQEAKEAQGKQVAKFVADALSESRSARDPAGK